jgi:hypothetical protein
MYATKSNRIYLSAASASCLQVASNGTIGCLENRWPQISLLLPGETSPQKTSIAAATEAIFLTLQDACLTILSDKSKVNKEFTCLELFCSGLELKDVVYCAKSNVKS